MMPHFQRKVSCQSARSGGQQKNRTGARMLRTGAATVRFLMPGRRSFKKSSPPACCRDSFSFWKVPKCPARISGGGTNLGADGSLDSGSPVIRESFLCCLNRRSKMAGVRKPARGRRPQFESLYSIGGSLRHKPARRPKSMH